ncbi:MAG: hypothetical protein KBA14_01595 [Saprospiraceae bacterium]|nr:hypothetical protein [Saprospiraceae bacterium]
MRPHPVFFLLLMGLSIPGYCQIGAKVQQQSPLCGNWENSQLGYQIMLILQPDGNGEFDGEVISFTSTDKTLSLAVAGMVTTYNYVLSGNSLQLSEGDLVSPVTFTKLGSAPSEDVTKSNVINPSSSTPGLSTPESSSGSIIGSWTGSGETIEFKSNGQCLYLGQTFPYRISSGQLTLSAADGEHIFSYGISGDKLILTAAQGSVTYTKSTSSSGSNAPVSSSFGGAIDQTLVSKWCYVDVNNYNSGASSSSTCVTLNADGSYEYYGESSRSVNTQDYSGGTSSQESDRGTWYVQGDRIFFNSQSKGLLSYRLEKRNHPKNVNDPMIVLDGSPFVTAYNMPPWRN